MVSKKKPHSDFVPVPLLLHESIYVGIDVGKARHVAGFVSTTLLGRSQRFEAYPVLVFENSREGFRTLIERMGSYTPLEQIYSLMPQSHPPRH